MITLFSRMAALYRDGFRSMVLGRVLWTVILVKLLLLYTVAKLFFPNYLQSRFATDQARAAYVLTVLAGSDPTAATNQHP